MLGPALLSKNIRRTPWLRPAILALAAGELLVDKLQGIPNRTAALPMTARSLVGALVAVASRPRRAKNGVLIAAALGAAAAAAGTLAGFYLRRIANRSLGGGKLANVATGALEDGLAVAWGRRLVH
jgi:uncharacterized membrane protein